MAETPPADRQPKASQRLDKWLWHARLFKTRTLAAKMCRARKVRIDGAVQDKASATVQVGNVLTFPKANRIFVVRVLAIGDRRGPAAEAQALYEDLSPPPPPRESRLPTPAKRDRGSGRPTKADRRAIDKLRGDPEA